jgi:hypothetical protein
VAWAPNRFWNLRERRKRRAELLLQVECSAGQERWPENVSGASGANFLSACTVISGIQQNDFLACPRVEAKSYQEHSY